MNLFWTERAHSDLLAIGRFIQEDNPVGARRFVHQLRERVQILRDSPQMGRIVPELQDSTIRELLFSNYRIVYRVKPDAVDVLTVFEGHKLLNKDLQK